MIIKSFGNPTKPIICLLHGGGLSWWSYQSVIDLLKEDYHILCPIIEGHGEAYQETFVSIEDSANHLIEFIESRYGSIHLLAGLSIGAQIALEVISKKPDITQFTILESALVLPIPGTKALIGPTYKLMYGLIKQRWFAKLQASSLFINEDHFEDYYRDSILMSRESLINISLSNGTYECKPLDSINHPVLILVGQKEIGIMKKSATLLHSKIKNSQLKILSNYGHGELSLVHPDEYVKMIKEYTK